MTIKETVSKLTPGSILLEDNLNSMRNEVMVKFKCLSA